MILINIDSLSTTELQYIAQQEGFENWSTLDRDELIEELEDAYEDQDDTRLDPNVKTSVVRKRFCNALTDYRGTQQDINGLPGVEDLPDTYAETSIHLLLRDPEWAYAYWSIAPTTRSSLFGENEIQKGDLFLRITTIRCKDKDKKTFDINIGIEDTQWNINLSDMGCSYSVALCFKDRKGTITSLAESKSVETFFPYWADHYDEIAMNRKLFNIHFSSVVTKEGEVADNVILREIAQTLSKGVL
ncbi:DUF4912 domain-containing protein [uncultured Sphaerochaeta sp.]|uniref:DUF4912 domain-containing protein n=1 Tax=uncultured Sphaerochaeta sp. TaxID=886478 RepID=UPI002A0A29E9|nr:DUF4912 domain-containing protein [uncultured Sphaerochaeta sp.]